MLGLQRGIIYLLGFIADILLAFLRLVLIVSLTFLHCPLYPLPKGQRVVHGSVSISQKSNKMLIEAAHKSIIEYSSFDIDSHEHVEFIQPHTHSKVLNRVIGENASQILGRLTANGQIYLINPSGIYFGPQSIVDVSALYAASGSLLNEDFLEDRDYFRFLGEKVESQGSIYANLVHLLGQQVINSGSIVIPNGVVAMIAAKHALIGQKDGHFFIELERKDSPSSQKEGVALEQKGTLELEKGEVHLHTSDLLWALSIRHLGKTVADAIYLHAHQGKVQMQGVLDTTGGDEKALIEVMAEEIEMENALLDASGLEGGGRIFIGGYFQGKGSYNAKYTKISNDSFLKANSLQAKDGGEIVVWSDVLTQFEGSIEAKGGELFGDGGLVEVSGKQYLDFRGSVDLSAPKGRVGSLLLDPNNVVIGDATSHDISLPLIDFRENEQTDYQISALAIEAALATADVSVSALGDISIESSIDTSSQASLSSLYLEAGNSISVLAGASITVRGDMHIQAENGVSLADSLTSEGTLYIDADSDYNNQGAITQSGGVLEADHLRLHAATGIATQASPLQTAVNSLQAIVRHNGGIYIQELDDIVVDDLDTKSGDISLVSSGNITVEGLVLPGGDLDIQTSGSFLQNHGKIQTYLSGDISIQASQISLSSISAAGELSLTASSGDIRFQAFPESYYQKIFTIDKNAISSNLGSFPVLVKLDSTSFDFSQAHTGGKDIRFVDASGNLLPYEIEEWNAANQEAWIWVRIPSISSSNDTSFTLYHGDLNETMEGDYAKHVWHTSFRFVHHMQDGDDSTAFNQDGQLLGDASFSDSYLGQGLLLSGSTDSTFRILDQDALDLLPSQNFDLSFWVNIDSSHPSSGYGSFLSKGTSAPYPYYVDYNQTSGHFRFIRKNNRGYSTTAVTPSPIANDTYKYITIARQSSMLKIFVDGVLQQTIADTTNTGTSPVSYENSSDLYIGSNGGLDRFFKGVIDEVRLRTGYNVAWTNASLYNQQNPTEQGSFYKSISTSTALDVGLQSSQAMGLDAQSGAILLETGTLVQAGGTLSLDAANGASSTNDVLLQGQAIQLDTTLAASNSISLTAASGGIAQSTGTLQTSDLTIQSSGDIASQAVFLQTDIDSLTASLTGNSSLYLEEANHLQVENLSVSSGAVSLTLPGNLIVNGTVSVSGGDLDIITTAGSIETTASGFLQTDQHLILSSVLDIGSLSSSLQTDAAFLLAQLTNSSNLYLEDQGDLFAKELQSDAGSIVLSVQEELLLGDVSTTSGEISLSSQEGSIIQESWGKITKPGSSALQLSAKHHIGLRQKPIRLDADAVDAQVSHSGDIFIKDMGGGLSLHNLSTTKGSIFVLSPGDISIEALSLDGPDLNLQSEGHIEQNQALITNSGNISFSSETMTLKDISTISGNIALTTHAGAPLFTGLSPLSAPQGYLILTSDTALGSLGSPIALDSKGIWAQVKGVGGMYFTKTGDLIVKDLDTHQGDIRVTSTQDMTLEGLLFANQGSVHLNAGGDFYQKYGMIRTHTSGDIVIVAQNVRFQSLQAEGDVNISSSSGITLDFPLAYNKSYVIDPTAIDEDLENFPVLVKLSSSDINFTHSHKEGKDLRFYDASGDLLDYEIELWKTNAAWVWVKLPFLSSTEETQFTLYTGNPQEDLDVQRPWEVWDANTQLVLHLSDASSSVLKDSSRYQRDGQAHHFNYLGQSDLDYSGAKSGESVRFDGIDDFIQIAAEDLNFSSQNPFTLEAWVYREGKVEEQGIIDKFDAVTNSGYALHLDSVNSQILTKREDFSGTSSLFGQNVFKHLASVYDGTDLVLYINGQEQTRDGLSALSVDNKASILLGAYWENDLQTGYFDGVLDEVKISDTARSQAWLRAQYLNQNNPTQGGSFYASISTAQVETTGLHALGSIALSDPSSHLDLRSRSSIGSTENPVHTEVQSASVLIKGVGDLYLEETDHLHIRDVFTKQGHISIEQNSGDMLVDGLIMAHDGDIHFKTPGAFTQDYGIIQTQDSGEIRIDASSMDLTLLEAVGDISLLADTTIYLNPPVGYAKRFQISPYFIHSNLKDFPVLVRLTGSNFDFSQAHSEGKDIRFLDANNNPLAHEIEKWTATDAYIWVKIPFVSSSLVTEFWMHHGNVDESIDGQRPHDLWDRNYLLVQHMQDTQFEDSTRYGASAYVSGTATTTAGRVGDGVRLPTDGDYVFFQNMPQQENVMTSFWALDGAWNHYVEHNKTRYKNYLNHPNDTYDQTTPINFNNRFYASGADGTFYLGKPPPTSPEDLEGLVLYLAADQIVGIDDQETVSIWEDVTRNAYDAHALSLGAAPVLKEAVLNGLPVVHFDGVNDGMEIVNSFSLARPYTAIIVDRYWASSTGNSLHGQSSVNWSLGVRGGKKGHYGGVGSGYSYIWGMIGYDGYHRPRYGWIEDSGHDWISNPSGPNAGTSWEIASGVGSGTNYGIVQTNNVERYANPRSAYFLDGQDLTHRNTAGANAGRLGLSAGGYGGASKVEIAEVIIYNEDIGALARGAVERYLSQKYNLAVSSSAAFTGTMDEVRVSNIARGGNWMTAEQRNYNYPTQTGSNHFYQAIDTSQSLSQMHPYTLSGPQGRLYIESQNSVGSSQTPLQTNVQSFSAHISLPGSIYIQEADHLLVEDVYTHSGEISITTPSGNMDLEGAILSTDGDIALTASGNIRQNKGAIKVSNFGDVNLSANHFTITSIETPDQVSILGNIQTSTLTYLPSHAGFGGDFFINADYIQEDLSDFPVVLQLNETNFDFQQGSGDGSGLRFYDDQDNLIAHEIASWDDQGKIAYVWVRVPQVSSTQNTKISLSYDEASLSSDQSVWANDYSLASHLEVNDSGEILESVTQNLGSALTSTVPQGVWGKGLLANPSGLSAQANVINLSGGNHTLTETLDALTLQIWLKPTSTPADSEERTVLDFGSPAGSGARLSLIQSNAGYRFFMQDGGTLATIQEKSMDTPFNREDWLVAEKTWDDEKGQHLEEDLSTKPLPWTLLTARWDAQTQNVEVFFNAQEQDSQQTSISSLPIDTSDILLGDSLSSASDIFQGILDEVRLSRVARSDAWIGAEYHNQKDSAVSNDFIEGTYVKGIKSNQLTIVTQGGIATESAPLQTQANVMDQILATDASVFIEEKDGVEVRQLQATGEISFTSQEGNIDWLGDDANTGEDFLLSSGTYAAILAPKGGITFSGDVFFEDAIVNIQAQNTITLESGTEHQIHVESINSQDLTLDMTANDLDIQVPIKVDGDLRLHITQDADIALGDAVGSMHLSKEEVAFLDVQGIFHVGDENTAQITVDNLSQSDTQKLLERVQFNAQATGGHVLFTGSDSYIESHLWERSQGGMTLQASVSSDQANWNTDTDEDGVGDLLIESGHTFTFRGDSAIWEANDFLIDGDVVSEKAVQGQDSQITLSLSDADAFYMGDNPQSNPSGLSNAELDRMLVDDLSLYFYRDNDIDISNLQAASSDQITGTLSLEARDITFLGQHSTVSPPSFYKGENWRFSVDALFLEEVTAEFDEPGVFHIDDSVVAEFQGDLSFWGRDFMSLGVLQAPGKTVHFKTTKSPLFALGDVGVTSEDFHISKEELENLYAQTFQVQSDIANGDIQVQDIAHHESDQITGTLSLLGSGANVDVIFPDSQAQTELNQLSIDTTHDVKIQAPVIAHGSVDILTGTDNNYDGDFLLSAQNGSLEAIGGDIHIKVNADMHLLGEMIALEQSVYLGHNSSSESTEDIIVGDHTPVLSSFGLAANSSILLNAQEVENIQAENLIIGDANTNNIYVNDLYLASDDSNPPLDVSPTHQIEDTITLNATKEGAKIYFTHNPSRFEQVHIYADNGIFVRTDLFSTDGDIVMDGNSDALDDTSDGIHFQMQSEGIEVHAQRDLILDAPQADMDASVALQLLAQRHVELKQNITAQETLFIGADSEQDGIGDSTVVAEKTVDTTDSKLTIRGDDIHLDGEIIRADGGVDLLASNPTTMGLGDSPSQEFDISDAELDRITTTGKLTIGGDQAHTTTVDNFTYAGSALMEINATHEGAVISFVNQASSADGALNVIASDGIHLQENLSSQGETLLESDSDSDALSFDETGNVTIDPSTVLSTGGYDLDIITNDFILDGDIEALGALTHIMSSDGGDIVLGDGLGDLTIAASELERITTGNFHLGLDNTSSILVDNISAQNSSNIAIRTTMTATKQGGQIRFIGGGSHFKELVLQADQGILQETDLTTSLDAFFDADTNQDGVGDYILDPLKSLNVVDHNLQITANDMIIEGSLSTQTGEATFIVSDGGDVFVANAQAALDEDSGWRLSGDEMERITAAHLHIQDNPTVQENGMGFFYVKEIQQIQVANIAELTLLAQREDKEIRVFGETSYVNAFNLRANRGVFLESHLETQGDVEIDADLDADGEGIFSLSSEKEINTFNHSLSVRSFDLILESNSSIDLSQADGYFYASKLGQTMGVGQTEARDWNLSLEEMQQVQGGSLTIGDMQNASIYLKELTQESNASIGKLILDARADDAQIVFEKDNTLQDLEAYADAGMDFNDAASLTALSGSIILDSDSDDVKDSNADILDIFSAYSIIASENIEIGAGQMGLYARQDLSLQAGDHVVLHDQTKVHGNFHIQADADQDGVGDFTLDTGKTLINRIGNLEIIADDIILDGSILADNHVDILAQTLSDVQVGGDGLGADFALSSGEVNRINTPGNVTLGGEKAENVRVNALNFSKLNPLRILALAPLGNIEVLEALTTSGNLSLLANDGVQLDAALSTKQLEIRADEDLNSLGDFVTLVDGDVYTHNRDALVSSYDIVLEGDINSGSGNLQLFATPEANVYIGGSFLPQEDAPDHSYTLSGQEFSLLQAEELLIGGPHIQQMTVGALLEQESQNINTKVTLDAQVQGGHVTFEDGPSTFPAIEVFADDGVQINQNITTTKGDLNINGDFDESADGRDWILIGDVILDSAGETNLVAKSGGVSFLSSMNILSQDHVVFSSDLIINNEVFIHADSEGDGFGSFILEDGVQFDTLGNPITIRANDLDLLGTMSSGAADTHIFVSDGGQLFIGDARPSNANQGMVIDKDELQRMEAQNLKIGDATNGNMYVEHVESTDLLGVEDYLFLKATAANKRIRFQGEDSDFKSLNAQAGDGILINANVSTTEGNLELDADHDDTAFLFDRLSLANEMTLHAANDLVLDGTTGGIKATASASFIADNALVLHDALDVNQSALLKSHQDLIVQDVTVANDLEVESDGNIYLEDNLVTGGDIRFSADHDEEGSGDITIRASVTVDANQGHITLIADDIHLEGNIVGADAGVDLLAQTMSDMDVGQGVVAMDFSISQDEIQRISIDGPLLIGGDSVQQATVGTIDYTANESLTLFAGYSEGGFLQSQGAINTVGSLYLQGADGVSLDAQITSQNALYVDADTDSDQDVKDQVGTLALQSGAHLQSNNHSIELVGNQWTYATGAMVDAGTSSISLFASDGDVIGLGLASGGFTVENAAFDHLQAHTLIVGGEKSGNIRLQDFSIQSSFITDTLKIYAGGDGTNITLDSDLNTDQNLILHADDGIFVSGNILSTGGNIEVDGDIDHMEDSSDTVVFSNDRLLDAAQDLILGGSSGNVTGGDGNLDLRAGRDIIINRYTNAGLASMDAGRDVLINGEFRDVGAADFNSIRDISIAGDFISLGQTELESGRDLLIGGNLGVSGSGDVTLRALANVNVSGTFSSEALASVIADNIEIGGSFEGGGSVSFDAQTDLTISGQFTSQGSASLDAGHHIEVDGGLVSQGEGAVTLEAGHSIVVNGQIQGTGSANLTAASSINIAGALTSQGEGAVEVISQGVLNIGGSFNNAQGSALIESVQDMTLSGPFNNEGTASLYSNQSIFIQEDFTSLGTTVIEADRDQDGTGVFNLQSGATLDAGGDSLTIFANRISLQGNVIGGGRHIQMAPQSSSKMGLGTYTTGEFDISNQELSRIQTSGRMIIGGDRVTEAFVRGLNYSAIGDLSVSATSPSGMITFTGTQSTISSSMQFEASDGIMMQANVTAGGNVVLHADSDSTPSENDQTGEFILYPGKTLNAAGAQVDILANEVDIHGTLISDKVDIATSDGGDIILGLGSSDMSLSLVELGMIQAEEFEIGDDNTANIFVNRVDLEGSIALARLIAAKQEGVVRFINNDSQFDALEVIADDGIFVDENLSALSSLDFRADISGDGQGMFHLSLDKTLTSQDGDLYLSADDVLIEGVVDIGQGHATLNVSDGGDLWIGDAYENKEGWLLSRQEFEKIHASQVLFGGEGSGDIHVHSLGDSAQGMSKVLFHALGEAKSLFFEGEESIFASTQMQADAGIYILSDLKTGTLDPVHSDHLKDGDGPLVIGASKRLLIEEGDGAFVLADLIMQKDALLDNSSGSLSFDISHDAPITVGKESQGGLGISFQELKAMRASFLSVGGSENSLVVIGDILSDQSGGFSQGVALQALKEGGRIRFEGDKTKASQLQVHADSAIEFSNNYVLESTQGNLSLQLEKAEASVTASGNLNLSSKGELSVGSFLSSQGNLTMDAGHLLLGGSLSAQGSLSLKSRDVLHILPDVTLSTQRDLSIGAEDLVLEGEVLAFNQGLHLYNTSRGSLFVGEQDAVFDFMVDNEELGRIQNYKNLSLGGQYTQDLLIDAMDYSPKDFKLEADTIHISDDHLHVEGDVQMHARSFVQLDTDIQALGMVEIFADSDSDGEGDFVLSQEKSLITQGSLLRVRSADFVLSQDAFLTAPEGVLDLQVTAQHSMGIAQKEAEYGLSSEELLLLDARHLILGGDESGDISILGMNPQLLQGFEGIAIHALGSESSLEIEGDLSLNQNLDLRANKDILLKGVLEASHLNLTADDNKNALGSLILTPRSRIKTRSHPLLIRASGLDLKGTIDTGKATLALDSQSGDISLGKEGKGLDISNQEMQQLKSTKELIIGGSETSMLLVDHLDYRGKTRTFLQALAPLGRVLFKGGESIIEPEFFVHSLGTIDLEGNLTSSDTTWMQTDVFTLGADSVWETRGVDADTDNQYFVQARETHILGTILPEKNTDIQKEIVKKIAQGNQGVSDPSSGGGQVSVVHATGAPSSLTQGMPEEDLGTLRQRPKKQESWTEYSDFEEFGLGSIDMKGAMGPKKSQEGEENLPLNLDKEPLEPVDTLEPLDTFFEEDLEEFDSLPPLQERKEAEQGSHEEGSIEVIEDKGVKKSDHTIEYLEKEEELEKMPQEETQENGKNVEGTLEVLDAKDASKKDEEKSSEKEKKEKAPTKKVEKNKKEEQKKNEQDKWDAFFDFEKIYDILGVFF